jgi:hypothetical protein
MFVYDQNNALLMRIYKVQEKPNRISVTLQLVQNW